MKTRILNHPTKALLWLSDLHFDQVSNIERLRFLQRIASSHYDAVLCTGDISTADYLADHLAEISQFCGGRPFFFTTGNHDYFGSSFAEVDRRVAEVCNRHPNLVSLGHGEIAELSSNTALIGHRGWYDGKAGNGIGTRVESPDHKLINDFTPLSRRCFFKALESLGKESATYFRQVLPSALMRYRTVILATHVPTYTQALRHSGSYCNLDRQPYYSNRAAGNAIMGISRNFRQRRIIIHAGHSHSSARVQMTPNLEINVAGAQPGRPAFQEPILID